jgi:small-conductance mechanosensitive channel
MPEIDWRQLGLDHELGGYPLWRWLAAAVTVLLVWLAAGVIVRLLRRRARAMQEKAEPTLTHAALDVLGRTRFWFVAVLGVYVGMHVFALDVRVRAFVDGLFVVAGWLQAGVWATGVLHHSIEQILRRRAGDDPAKLTSLAALNFLGRLVLWSLVLLLALDNLGVNVTALVAGFGIGGIAVALAAQNVFADLFASLAIVLDRPFEVGDFIIVGDLLGTVEHIGMKTTRVRSLSGEQLIFGNTDLLGSRIRNFKRMKERRVVFSFGVVYGTPADRMEQIPGWVREAVESQSPVRFDRAHFKEYGESALQFEVVYYVLVSDYTRYMDIQQAINLQILRTFEEHGVAFAYPTRTIHVHSEAG